MMKWKLSKEEKGTVLSALQFLIIKQYHKDIQKAVIFSLAQKIKYETQNSWILLFTKMKWKNFQYKFSRAFGYQTFVQKLKNKALYF